MMARGLRARARRRATVVRARRARASRSTGPPASGPALLPQPCGAWSGSSPAPSRGDLPGAPAVRRGPAAPGCRRRLHPAAPATGDDGPRRAQRADVGRSRWRGAAHPARRGAASSATGGSRRCRAATSSVPGRPGVRSERLARRGTPSRPGQHPHPSRAHRLAGRSADADFPAWIRRIRALKAERSAARSWRPRAAGWSGCCAAGVTTVADTGDSGRGHPGAGRAGGSGIAYHEVFGPHPGPVERALAASSSAWTSSAGSPSGRVRLGVSPHAPYTVSGPLYAAAAAVGRSEGLPIAVHLAESPAEERTDRRGPRDPSREPWRGPRHPACRRRRGDHAGGVARAARRAGGRARSASTRSRPMAPTSRGWPPIVAVVAHCPRSNRHHAGREAPLAAAPRGRAPGGVGTDSVASVGPLDLLAEARAARTLAGLDAAAAARALHPIRGPRHRPGWRGRRPRPRHVG